MSDTKVPPFSDATGSPDATVSPDAVLGLWTNWMEKASTQAQAMMQPVAGNWDAMAGSVMSDSLAQIRAAIADDATLRQIDQMWNANPMRDVVPVDWAAVSAALRTVWLRALRNPGTLAKAAVDMNAAVLRAAADAWADATRAWMAGAAPAAAPQAAAATSAAAKPGAPKPAGAGAADKRFAAADWHTNPAHRTLKDAYLLASDWLLHQGEADDLDPAERRRLQFHLRQFVDAMSPALMLVSNPVALRRAMETGGASVATGLQNLLSDLKEGRLSMVDETAFAPGRNLALSPGKVVHRNKLIELIQYSPTTPQAHAVPLLILPPWINKFYILDLQPKNSMVAHLVGQGFTVFMVSWRNPDESLDGTTIEDYMDLGPLEASDVVRQITGSETVNVMGYCIGGTLLAMTLAYLANKGDSRFGCATFMVSLQDFSRVGDSAVFMDDPAVDLVEQQMMQRGYLDSRSMSNMFNLLRSNDLIWSNVVNNYLMGQKPPAFDLLYWNSDGTRMTRAAHTWYLRNTYVENNLIHAGKVELKGERLDLGRITLAAYAVGAEKDHIVPWDAAWRLTQLAGGTVRYVLASSGHIAGIINPPGGKGTYWAAEPGQSFPTAEAWRAGAAKHDGSWWSDWTAWLSERSGAMGAPPPLGSNLHPAMEDAPGTYVLQKY